MGSRSASSFSVDVSVQISAHRVVQLDAATQLDITEFLIGWIYSDRPLDRRHPFQSPSSILGAHAAPLPPPGLEPPLPVIATQPQSHTNVSSSHCPTLQPTASTTHVGTHTVRPAGAKRSASTAHAGNHNSYGPCPRTEVTPFPKPNAVVLPILNFGHSKICGPSPVATADSDIMHHQFRLSLLQLNPGPARRNPTNIVSAACGKFHAVILQEASDHVPHISAYFLAYTDNTDLAILLNKDTFEPDPFVTSFKVESTSKNTWGMVLLIVRALLRRPSISGTPTVTFCSVHIHNVVAKKRGASTDLLQVLHAKMLEHTVDFIGGDFNMSVFTTVSVNTIHPAPEIHEHFMIQKATKQCAQPQAHSQQRGAQCDQLREQHDAHRRDDRAALSTLRAVYRCVIRSVHTVTFGSRASQCLSISSMVIVMRTGV